MFDYFSPYKLSINRFEKSQTVGRKSVAAPCTPERQEVLQIQPFKERSRNFEDHFGNEFGKAVAEYGTGADLRNWGFGGLGRERLS